MVKMESHQPSKLTFRVQVPVGTPLFERIVKCGKYHAIYCPDHPNAWPNGYMLLHRIVMESVVGRILSDHEVVHHVDGNKRNNTPSNLVLMTPSEHTRHHHPDVWLEVI